MCVCVCVYIYIYIYIYEKKNYFISRDLKSFTERTASGLIWQIFSNYETYFATGKPGQLMPNQSVLGASTGAAPSGGQMAAPAMASKQQQASQQTSDNKNKPNKKVSVGQNYIIMKTTR